MTEREEKRRAGNEAAATESVVKSIMATYEGRWWMCELLGFSSMYQACYHNDGDVYAALKRDGKADVGRYVLGQIDEYAPNDYARLIREMKARSTREAERVSKAAEDIRKDESGEVEFYSPLEDAADRQRARYEAAELAPEEGK